MRTSKSRSKNSKRVWNKGAPRSVARKRQRKANPVSTTNRSMKLSLDPLSLAILALVQQTIGASTASEALRYALRCLGKQMEITGDGGRVYGRNDGKSIEIDVPKPPSELLAAYRARAR